MVALLLCMDIWFDPPQTRVDQSVLLEGELLMCEFELVDFDNQRHYVTAPCHDARVTLPVRAWAVRSRAWNVYGYSGPWGEWYGFPAASACD